MDEVFRIKRQVLMPSDFSISAEILKIIYLELQAGKEHSLFWLRLIVQNNEKKNIASCYLLGS